MIQVEELILLKVIKVENGWFVANAFLICNGCHDLSVLCLNISDIANITVKNVDYRCIMHNITKSEATHLLENSVLEDRGYL